MRFVESLGLLLERRFLLNFLTDQKKDESQGLKLKNSELIAGCFV
jgi:hypothetical protein